jgi:hypothetical protein
MTLFQKLKQSAEQRPIQIEPIPSDLLTTEQKNELLRITTEIREQIQARTECWQRLTHHYEPLE